MVEIIAPFSSVHFDAVRDLCWQYRDYLRGLSPFDAEIVENLYPTAKYTRLMDELEATHTPPNGAIRLALKDEEPVGCGMTHRLMPGTAEIKRVFVTDAARGTGAGRALMQALIEQCRTDGYERILMDTSTPLKAAQKLYLSLGFTLRGPYQDVPALADGHLVFFEMTL
jgi:GNAT superfamily N-acetyltransferase